MSSLNKDIEKYLIETLFQGVVRGHTKEELKKMSLGEDDKSKKKQEIPTVLEVLEFIDKKNESRNKNLMINIELKGYKSAEETAKVLSNHLKTAEHNKAEDVVVLSFDHEDFTTFKDSLDPNIRDKVRFTPAFKTIDIYDETDFDGKTFNLNDDATVRNNKKESIEESVLNQRGMDAAAYDYSESLFKLLKTVKERDIEKSKGEETPQIILGVSLTNFRFSPGEGSTTAILNTVSDMAEQGFLVVIKVDEPLMARKNLDKVLESRSNNEAIHFVT